MRVMADRLPAAPGADQHPALDLVNSAMRLPVGEVDLLADPAGATDWLVSRGLAPDDILLPESCASRLRQMRDHVRALMTARIAGTPPDSKDLDTVNAALTRAPSADVLRWDAARGWHRSAAHPTDEVLERALAVLAADAA